MTGGGGRKNPRLNSHTLNMNESLCTLIDAMPDFIAIKDGQGKWELCNKSGLSMYGLSDIPYQGRTDGELATLTSPDYTESLRSCIISDERAWAAGVMSSSVETVPVPSGETLYFDVVKVPLFNPDNSRKRLIVIGRNVTELVNARAEEKLAGHIFDNSLEAIVVTDASARIIRVNQQFTQLTGYKEDEVLGRNPNILSSGKHDKDFYKQMWLHISLERHWHGEVWDRRKNGEIYPKWLTISAVTGEDGRITQYVGAFTDITDQKAAIEQINFLAHHDPLTKLPNRILLKDRFEQSAAITSRNQQQMAVLFLDLDHFKDINDTLGHMIGDQMLLEVTCRLKSCVRESDTLSRLGGDEFVILLPDIPGVGVAQSVAEKILHLLRKVVRIGDHKLHTGCSIGISLYPEEGEDFDSLSHRVIAEGVETQSQMDFLERESCDEVQGYLTGKPIEGKFFPQFLKAVA